MQNPAETPASSDRKVPAPSAGNGAAPVPSPLRTPPPRTPDSTPPQKVAPREVGGPSGPEPTRFGDWERKGRCIDF